MYRLIINEEIETLGLVSIQIEANENGGVNAIGILKTHTHVDEIESIECDRFLIKGINVYLEAFSNTDVYNLYRFTFSSYEIKDNCNYTDEELIKLYEREVERENE
jgi:hypothetical protein